MQTNLRRNNKAVSTVFGMVFFLLIAVIIFASFSAVLTQTMNLESTLATTRQMDNEKNREELFIVKIAADEEHDANLPTYTGGVLSCSVINPGTIAAQVVRIWVEDSDGRSAFVDVRSDPNSFISENQQSPSSRLGGTVTATTQGAPNENDPDLSIRIITARGNQFSYKTTGPQGTDGADGTKWYSGTEYTEIPQNRPPSSFADPITQKLAHIGDYYLNTETYDLFQKQSDTEPWAYLITLKNANGIKVAQGIGKFSMDFDDFNYYKITQNQGNYYADINNPKNGFDVVKSDAPILFRVKITNCDSLGRDMYISTKSMFWCLFPTTIQQPRGAFWYLVQIDSTGKIQTAPSYYQNNPIILPYTPAGSPTYLYFASGRDLSGGFSYPDLKNMDPGMLAAVNLGIIGNLGSQTGPLYGQNLPFVQITVR